MRLLVSLTGSFLVEYDNYLVANKEYESLYKGYVANFPYNNLKKKFYYLYQRIDENVLGQLFLKSDELELVNLFIGYYKRTEEDVEIHNRRFLVKELVKRKRFFDIVAGVPLDAQQRRAIIANEDNNLVIAGAGSGKTTTIVGKVKYLVDVCGVSPDRILLMSFTRKAVENLALKVNVNGVVAKTFNSFGLEVLKESIYKQSIFDSSQFPHLIQSIFKKLMNDDNYLRMVTDFFIAHYKIEKDIFEFETHGEYIDLLKDENFQPIELANSTRKKITLKHEKVKSIEECKIANFLYFNRVEYIYEYPYEFKTATKHKKNYQPDFSIFVGDKRIYLEHFGINKKGEPAPIFHDPEDYKQGIIWKRNLHRQNQTILVESYSFENSEGILLENLKKNLERHGVVFNLMSQEEIWSILQKKDPKGEAKFLEIVRTFIVLLKSNSRSIEIISSDLSTMASGSNRTRLIAFLDIIKPIYLQYQNHLSQRGEIDFSDMINHATKCIAENKFRKQFDYIIVDEFQDLSTGRFQLIKSLKESNPFCKLFAVGDDWQSIYRFAGADITLFSEFEKYFGYTHYSKIETTYRFKEPLITISSEFILQNPNQLRKDLKAFSSQKGQTNVNIIQYYQYATKEEKLPNFLESLISILEEHIFADCTTIDDFKGSIYLLGRYNYDLNKLVADKGGKKTVDLAAKFKILDDNITYSSSIGDIKMKFLTVHKAKGLEGDYVIILNNDAGEYGFPSLRSDDPVLSLLLSGADQFENGEERRLFYVALTRAREKVFLMVNNSNMSKFISELVTDKEKEAKCPQCKTGNITLKTGMNKETKKTWAFESCSNFTFGCSYQVWK